MGKETLYIKLEQIPNGVRLSENFSRALVNCIQQDHMTESLEILRGLISIIGEINRGYFFNVLYSVFGYNVKTMRNYLYALAEKSDSDHLFARGHGDFFEELIVDGSVPFKAGYSFEISIDPGQSENLEVKIKDNLFTSLKDAENHNWDDPAVITAAAFADVLYGELYFPAIKLMTGDIDSGKTKAFIRKTLDEQFVPFV